MNYTLWAGGILQHLEVIAVQGRCRRAGERRREKDSSAQLIGSASAGSYERLLSGIQHPVHLCPSAPLLFQPVRTEGLTLNLLPPAVFGCTQTPKVSRLLCQKSV